MDLNDTVVDKFDYKVTDGADEAYTRLTITIKGINDDPVGVVNTDAVTLGSSLNRADGSSYDIYWEMTLMLMVMMMKVILQ